MKLFVSFNLLLFCSLNLLAVSIAPYEKAVFNLSEQKEFIITVLDSQAENSIVSIYSPDHILVKTLKPVRHEKQRTIFSWDGTDTNNELVPDEAYVPVVKYLGKSYDSRELSGGEEFQLEPTVDSQGTISFNLAEPSRVLIRAGTKAGPLLNNISTWQARPAGRNRIAWDGYDHNDLTRVLDLPDFALLAIGFKLPKHTILVQGNAALSYREWIQNNQYDTPMPDFASLKLDRNNERLSRHYYLPRTVDIEPRVTLEIKDAEQNAQGANLIIGPVMVQVNLHPDDIWALQQGLYEISFFLDDEFISEEEQGYVPLRWRWTPNNVKPGLHRLTVNVSGFEGQVGVQSILVFVTK